MNILIVDDEAPARQRLRSLLESSAGDYTVVGEAGNGEQAVAACRSQAVDLVLMDIRMPGMDGLAAALQLAGDEHPPAVIFTTAYDEHALKAFEANAVDYLLKPIRRQRLFEALQKAHALTRVQLGALRSLSSDTTQDFLSASLRGELLRIPVDQVFFLRAEHKYVVVRHAGGEALLEDSLKSLEERYPGRFQRIHRNALVNPLRVSGLHRSLTAQAELSFTDIDDRLEVSRRHLPAVRQWLKGG